jgi:hypothetical protein
MPTPVYRWGRRLGVLRHLRAGHPVAGVGLPEATAHPPPSHAAVGGEWASRGALVISCDGNP